jgi:hypothetical protein
MATCFGRYSTTILNHVCPSCAHAMGSYIAAVYVIQADRIKSACIT